MTTQNSLLAEIASLRTRSATLDLSGADFRRYCEQAIEPLSVFIDGLADAPAFPAQSDHPISAEIGLNSNKDAAVHRLIATQLEGGMEHGSGGFMGYIPGGGLLSAAVADLVVAVTNRYSGFTYSAPGAARTENQVIEWLSQLFGLGPNAWGCLTSGGTMATLNCLLAARETVDHMPAEKMGIYLTDQAHHAVSRTLKTLGLHRSAIHTVATDSRLRMDVADLSRAIELHRQQGVHPFLVVASAGTTNTGAIDPLPEIARVARENSLWFHVDAAYGGFFILSESGRALLQGIEQADSLVVDAHKGMFLPHGIGASLVRNADQLKAALQEDAPYLHHSAAPVSKIERSPADYSFELTRHNRAPRIRLSLDLFGVEPFAAALSEKLLLARWLFQQLSQISGIEVLGQPELTVVAFRAASEAHTQALAEAVICDGQVFASPTRIRGEFWMRACIVSFRTHLEHVEALVSRVRAFQAANVAT